MPGLEDEQSVNMDKLTQLQDCIEQLLLIMKLAVVQLVQRSDFKQVSPDIPVTKSRPKDKIDSPQKFEENKRELVADLVRKAKQIELIIESLPAPEPEQAQAARFEQLEQEMQKVNEEYQAAVERAKRLHKEITAIFRELTNAENTTF
ncbi:hypothetical protein M408DRAFT_326382 [Serendipita vermifera MAFF 305830]|uniref:Mediator of RNA polymerase II transcription subunit 21 n=1 Tax=Serendipita vermifera MAFF 305830 TaxID=933852 RepID=A0A0C3BKQ4_SERVB|nr:hypothetical protein M408DRAFT_326382 [Serendipita vermifera MAFF 305830]